MIEDEVKEFKKKNGNGEYTQKDMLMYILSTQDKINNKNERQHSILYDKIEEISHMINDGKGKIKENREATKSIKYVLTVLIPVIFLLIGWLFTLVT